jgi:hypothetical protein
MTAVTMVAAERQERIVHITGADRDDIFLANKNSIMSGHRAGSGAICRIHAGSRSGRHPAPPGQRTQLRN